METSTVFWMIINALFFFIYLGILFSVDKENKQLKSSNKELKSELETLKKQLETSETNLKNEQEISNNNRKAFTRIEEKYNFMRKNTRKFNVGDKVGVYTIENIDVKIPGIVDHLIGAGKIFINWLTGTTMKPETDPHFVYECSDGNPINTRFTENQLVTIAKEFKKAPKKSKTKTN